ncbi:helix-turn-helix domain-containing protein [Pseudonocardia alni]|uniref:helix-turn-helix domain-containing protein n=1 Tax=Pseudonocardia alni TaxID=33907 RepID=UPI0033255100
MATPAGGRPVTAAAGPARLWVGPCWAVHLGPMLGLDAHRGAVACLAVGVDDDLTVRVDGAPDRTARTLLVPAGLRHRITGGANRAAFVFLEPGRGPAGIVTGHPAEPDLVACAVDGDGPGLRRILVDSGTAPGARAEPDARIARAIAALHRPGGPDLPTGDLAAAAGLSPGHFARLFTRQTGAGLRAYRRWARMRIVAGVVRDGGDLTRAAADAGFATPSHLGLAFRRMFGLPPGRLFRSGLDIRVVPGQVAATTTSAPAATASTRP